MKKPVKKTAATKAKHQSAAQKRVAARKKLARQGATAVARARASLAKKHKTAAKKKTVKRTLSLHGPHVATASWKDRLLKLGRNQNDSAKPRLELDTYLNAGELATPSVVDFASEVVTWPMYGNDTIGDCTAACVGHQVQAWTCYTGAEVDIPEPDIIQLYSAVSGYDPQTGANDNGATVQDTLTYMRKSGVPVAGHKILAFAQLKDLSKIHDALWMFGSVYLGFACPESALEQFDADQPWDVVAHSPIAGGHAVPVQYAGTGNVPYQVVTWGRLQGMTQAFMSKYVEEAWVIITVDWLDKNGHTPEGLDLQALGADLAALTGDPNPFPAPVPPAPPEPPQPVPAPPEPTPVPVPTPTPEPPAPDDPKAALLADLEILQDDFAILQEDFAKTVRDAEKAL